MTTRSLFLAIVHHPGHQWMAASIQTRRPSRHGYVRGTAFVTGERRCPPEDVGGFPGFEMFLHAMADPSHEEHTYLRRWHGGPFNAADIDEQAITRRIAAIAKRRQVGKAAYAKGRKSA